MEGDSSAAGSSPRGRRCWRRRLAGGAAGAARPASGRVRRHLRPPNRAGTIRWMTVDHTDDALGRLVWDEAEQRAAQGDTAYVRDLGAELAGRRAAAAERVRDYKRQLAHVVRVLALTLGRDSLAQLLRLLDARSMPDTSGLGQRFVASLLAEHHRVADLAAVAFDRSERDRRHRAPRRPLASPRRTNAVANASPSPPTQPFVQGGWRPSAAASSAPSQALCLRASRPRHRGR
ncbi:DUF6183 family protein [Streptomyces sp. 5K101]|uniref:DUF6183 family protein n=1 Tax=Streptomyces sp. 5K101 TaxID=3390037 RepID=UPI0039761D88